MFSTFFVESRWSFFVAKHVRKRSGGPFGSSRYCQLSDDTSEKEVKENLDCSQIQEEEDRLILETAFRILSKEECQIIILHAVSGLKHREISGILHLPLSTVLSKYNREIKKLRAQLEEMDLKHTDLDVAMNALIGSMVKHGYLSEARHVVLVSVESSDSRKAEQLKSHVSEEIYTYLENLIGSGKVFEQQIQRDTELNKIAKTYRITPGKAAIMKKIVQLYPELDYVKLASLSLEELMEYLETDEEDDLEEWKEEQKSSLSEEDLEDDFPEESEDQEAEETEQEGIETESD